jgi:flagellar L-ring protein precursor FlgH
MKKLVPLVALSTISAACSPSHIRPHTARERDYRQGQYADSTQAASEGSLWPDNSRGLFADFRAYRIGDLVTIRIDETASATGDAATNIDRESSFGVGVGGALTGVGGLLSALQRSDPSATTEDLIRLVSSTSFSGTGSTERGSRVNASIAVRVKQTMPNSDLFVEGTKVIQINNEELHIYISGVIRPEDIQQDNSVKSSLVADAQIELTGRGALTDNQQQGWLTRLLQAVNPF